MHQWTVAGTSPEVECLLACVRYHFADASTEELKACCERPLDWPHVLQLAHQHRVTPLLYGSLKAISSAVPPQLLQRVDRARRLNVARNLRAAARANALLRRFESEAIRTLSFKGPTLAIDAYGSLALRMFDDIDLLIRRDDLERACDILASEGFVAEHAMSSSHRDAVSAQARPFAFVSELDHLTIDVHVALTPGYQPPRIDTSELIDRSVSVDVLGYQVRTLSREALLVLLSAHGTKHMWQRLVWVADVAALVRSSPPPDWRTVQRLADEWNCTGALRLACGLAARLLRTPIPPFTAGADSSTQRIDSLILRATRRLVVPSSGPPMVLELARFHLQSIDRWRDRWRYIRAMMQPSEADRSDVAHPGRLGVLRYPQRIYRLLVRGPATAAERPRDG